MSSSGTTEHTLAQIWQEVLGVTGVQPEDNFFNLGGHSLAAIRIVTAARE